MERLSDKTVAIVGGGIGGMTAALAFARTGAEVILFERAPSFEEVGAGLQLTPNGARALEALGVTVAGVVAEAVVPSDALTGRAIARIDLRAQSPVYRFLHRAVLLDCLLETAVAQGVTLRNGVAIDAADADGTLHWAGGQQAADLVVFADGLHSIGREVLNGPAEAKFTGQVAWRAVVQSKSRPEARIWMGPGRHLVTYPLSEALTNIVAVEERPAWAAEGWHHRDDPANLRAAFAGSAPEVTALLEPLTEVNLWGLFRHPVADRWHDARRVLIGDAAHPTLPFLAQGANLAIEDAYVLARCVEDQAGNIEAGLTRFQSARRARVVRAIEAANANARNYHLRGMPRLAAHLGIRAMNAVAPGMFLRRFSWLYDHDVTQPADQGEGQRAASG